MADTINKKIDVTLSIKGNITKDLKDISKLPGLKQFASNLERISKIGSIPTLSKFAKDLKALDGIKVPSLNQLAVGLEKIAAFKGRFPKFKQLSTDLKLLDSIKVPQLKQLVAGLEKLSQVNTVDAGSKIRVLVRNLKSLSQGISIPKINQLAAGLQKLNTVDVSESTARLKRLNKVLQDLFRDLSNLPAINQLATGLKKLQSIDISKAVAKLKELNIALQKLPGGGAFLAGLGKVSSAIERLGGDFSKINRKVQETTVTFGNFGQVAVKYLRYRVIASSVMFLSESFRNGIVAIGGYDQALKNLQAITDATESQVEQMGVVMREVANNTKFSVTEIGNSMVLLGQAGLTATESIAAMPHIAALASGTLTDLTSTADLVTTSLRVFSIAAKDTQEVVDTFANAVNGSKLTIDKLATSMNYVGPIAHEVGLSLQETSASMMTLANSGLRASTIGTSLRRILIELASPSDKLAAAAVRAGVSLGSLNTNANSMTSVLGSLRDVISAAGDDFAQAGLAADLFGKRGASGLLALIKNAEDGSLIFENMLITSERVGTAQRMQQIQLKGLATSWKNLTDKIELLIVSMGRAGLISIFSDIISLAKGVTDSLRALVDNGVIPFIVQVLTATTAVYALGAAFVFLKKQAGIAIAAQAAQTIVSVGTGAATAATGIGILGRALIGLKAILVALKLAFLANPWFWVAAGVAAITIATIKLVKWLKKTKSGVEETSDELARSTEKWRQAGAQISKYQERVQQLSKSGTDTIKSQIEQRELLNELIIAYPEYAKEIIAASGNLDDLSAALDKVGESVRLKELESARKETIKFSESIDEQKKKLIGLAAARQKLLNSGTADPKAVRNIELEIQNANRTIDNSIAMIAYTIKQFEDEGIEVDWNKILGPETAAQAFKFVEDISKNSVKNINETLSTAGNISAKELLVNFKAVMEERTTVHKQALYQIALDEADSVIDQEEADRKREKSTEDHYRERLRLAQEYFNNVASTQGQGPSAKEYQKAYKAVEDATQQLYDKSIQVLQSHSDKRDSIQEKMLSSEKSYSEKVLSIQEQLNSKLKGFSKKREKIELDSAKERTDIERGISDDIFRIKQQSLTADKQERASEKRARELRLEGIKQIERARASADQATLYRGRELLDQSRKMYNSLVETGDVAQDLKGFSADRAELLKKISRLSGADKQKAQKELVELNKRIRESSKELRETKKNSDIAVRGLERIQDALLDAEQIAKRIKITEVNEEEKAVRDVFKIKMSKAEELHNDSLAKIKKEYDYHVTRLNEIKRLAESVKFGTSTDGTFIQQFASGGSPDFQRPTSPLVTKGSAVRDNVKALLMRDEFVMRSAAVKKYGVAFMSSINNGVFDPLMNSIRTFGLGGFVGGVPVTAMAGGGVVTTKSGGIIDVNLNLPVKGAPIPVQINRAFVSDFLRQVKEMGRITQ